MPSPRATGANAACDVHTPCGRMSLAIWTQAMHWAVLVHARIERYAKSCVAPVKRATYIRAFVVFASTHGTMQRRSYVY